jgi:hypothetical protein
MTEALLGGGDQDVLYKLTRNALGVGQFIELTVDEYESIVLAKRRLIAALELEETFDLLLENFVEYERALFDSSLTSLLHRRLNWSAFREDRARLNRRIVNLLSSTRLYIDQSKRDVQIVDEASDSLDFLCGLLSEQYDSHVEYRAMDALRNYVQHRGMAVGLLSFPGAWVKDERGQRLLRHATAIGLDIERVAEEPKIKASVRAELKALGKALDLTAFLRKYIECLGNVHEQLRKRLSSILSDSAQVLTAALKRAETKFDDDVGIVIIKQRGDEIAESHDLFHDIETRRQELSFKNSIFANLSLRYVSGEVPR